jgi:hypothetical protein
VLAEADAVQVAAEVLSVDDEVEAGFDLAWVGSGQLFAGGGDDFPVVDLAVGEGPGKGGGQLFVIAAVAKPVADGVEDGGGGHLAEILILLMRGSYVRFFL